MLRISFLFIKKEPADKPGSVRIKKINRLTLSVPSFICDPALTVPVAVYPPARTGRPFTAGILDLATHGRCGPACHHTGRWSLTPPFHLYPVEKPKRAVIFCHLYPTVTDRFPLGSMVPLLPGLSSGLISRNYQSGDGMTDSKYLLQK